MAHTTPTEQNSANDVPAVSAVCSPVSRKHPQSEREEALTEYLKLVLAIYLRTTRADVADLTEKSGTLCCTPPTPAVFSPEPHQS